MSLAATEHRLGPRTPSRQLPPLPPSSKAMNSLPMIVVLWP